MIRNNTFQVSNWMIVGTRTVSITTQKQSSVNCIELNFLQKNKRSENLLLKYPATL